MWRSELVRPLSVGNYLLTSVQQKKIDSSLLDARHFHARAGGDDVILQKDGIVGMYPHTPLFEYFLGRCARPELLRTVVFRIVPLFFHFALTHQQNHIPRGCSQSVNEKPYPAPAFAMTVDCWVVSYLRDTFSDMKGIFSRSSVFRRPE